MKIAQVSPIFESVPPKTYGGTERIVSYLTEELVRQGHDVTLFASGDSVTEATLISAIDQSLRQDIACKWLAYHTIQMDQVAALADTFDVIHFHTDYLHFPVAKKLRTCHATTMHGRLDTAECAALFSRFDDVPIVSISDHQRIPLPMANWQSTVYHGLPANLYAFSEKADDYFVFLGRASPEKRIDRAIDIAHKCGVPIYIAAKIDPVDELYFNEHIKPLLCDPLVNFVGEVGEEEKRALLENARALLFPIDWPEPFGLVMIEALCCGTPVIAFGNGSVPEIVENGVSGFVVSSQEEAVHAAQRIGSIDRRACRAAFERRFTAARMADNYLRVYRKLLGGRAHKKEPERLERPEELVRTRIPVVRAVDASIVRQG